MDTRSSSIISMTLALRLVYINSYYYFFSRFNLNTVCLAVALVTNFIVYLLYHGFILVQNIRNPFVRIPKVANN